MRAIPARERETVTDLQPRGEALRNAVRFLSRRREDDPDARIGALVEEATLRFDLSPVQSEWLLRFARETARRDASGDDG